MHLKTECEREIWVLFKDNTRIFSFLKTTIENIRTFVTVKTILECQ